MPSISRRLVQVPRMSSQKHAVGPIRSRIWSWEGPTCLGKTTLHHDELIKRRLKKGGGGRGNVRGGWKNWKRERERHESSEERFIGD